MTDSPRPVHPISHIEVDMPGSEWVDKVYLDGVEQPNAIAASETKGYVIRWELTEDGELRMNAWGEEVVAEKVEGKVEITLRDEPRGEGL